ncbi:unnamed protein product [Microthlaspi erraticum]|uniref:Uncharacterized protein n=1 Tax=Microthlaspi erraticum TaxID=1685480 RepID=A0A6D2J7B4_9BRAS|nr:unnamed protein product [Microthlaspi erraticum]
MQSLRSVSTQATRGGRWVASRRNFSSSKDRELGLKEALVESGYACIGVVLYSALAFGRRELAYQELYEAKKLAMSLI